MYILTVILLTFILYYIVDNNIYDISIRLQTKRSHPTGYPITQIQNDFYTPERCKALSKYISKHKFVGRSTLDGFGKTKGFVVTFSSQHEKRFLDTFKPIHEVFKQIQEPGTNAYIFNPVIIEHSTKETERSIPYHYDMSLSDQVKTPLGRNYLPVCVTVIYIHLPESYKGGELCLSDYCTIYDRDVKIYKPKLGRKLIFRGDALHHVEPIYCKGGKGKRISLVFEQYRLPESKVANIKFHISKDVT
jgi:hypothetical protein